MKTRLLLVLSFLIVTQLHSQSVRPNLFAEYAGKWKGTFYVYSPDGKLLNKLEAEHSYRISDPYTLEGTQTVRYPDGSIERIQAKDYVQNGKLYCRVESDRSGVKILEGKMEGNQIFWWRHQKDVTESFRERVINGGRLYAIDGYGIYGADHTKVYTFFAEYRRIQ